MDCPRVPVDFHGSLLEESCGIHEGEDGLGEMLLFLEIVEGQKARKVDNLQDLDKASSQTQLQTPQRELTLTGLFVEKNAWHSEVKKMHLYSFKPGDMR